MSKSTTEKIKGYKVTNPESKCRGYLYEVGKTYTHKGNVEMCGSGFHFCLEVANCFNYYSFDSANKVYEVEASGKVIHGDDKSVCSELTIVRELSWQEMLCLANQGNRNTGNWNTGNWNTGNRNTGNWNTGNRNTGNRNTGDRNTGNRNTGNWNTGNWNTGNRNTGNWNTGDRNTGYSNTGNRNTGAFCTLDAPFPMFNEKSNWTEEDFKNSRAYELMCDCVDTKMWVYSSQMTDEEKAAHPSHKTADGYLKDIPFKEAFQNAWHNWNQTNREAFTSLPNFSWKIFTEITGVEKPK